MNKSKFMLGLLVSASAAAFASQAQAAGTAAGTDVNNTASIGYSTGGVAQAAVNSNTATFKVDEKINLTVAELGNAATSVAPNSTNQVTTFTVTNTSNATQDFRLTATQDANGVTGPFGGTDSFDATNLRIFVDANNNGTYDAGTDTATFIDELAADQSRTVFVVADIPANQPNATIAAVTLTATAAVDGTAGTLGADQTQTAGADNATTVDIVFADGAGDTDAARDGKFSDDDQYNVTAATLSLTKTSKIISDPFNNTTNPKRIPGATIEYCLIAANTGGASATAATITDNLADVPNVTYVAGSIFTGVTVTGGVCNTNGTQQTDAADGDNASFASNLVTASVGTIATGTSTAVRFRVTVN
jgi:hypothetical protein